MIIWLGNFNSYRGSHLQIYIWGPIWKSTVRWGYELVFFWDPDLSTRQPKMGLTKVSKAVQTGQVTIGWWAHLQRPKLSANPCSLMAPRQEVWQLRRTSFFLGDGSFDP